jgi:hypothetical protein
LKITGVISNVFRPQKIQIKQEKIIYNLQTFPAFLHGSEIWTIKAIDTRRITAAEMKYKKKMAEYTWTDYKANKKLQCH